MKLSKMASVIILSCCATSSFAMISSANGWYVNGKIATTHISKNGSVNGTNLSRTGYSGGVGYKLMPYSGVEIGYMKFGDSTVNDQFGNKAFNDKHHAYYLAMKAMVPVEETGVEPYAKIGVQRITQRLQLSNQTAANNLGVSSGTQNANGLYLAVGADYYFTPQWAAGLEWQRAKGNGTTGTYDLYGFGLTYLS